MTTTEARDMIEDLEQEVRWLIIDKLQSVIDGDYELYNEVSKEYIPVDNDRMDQMVDMFIDLLSGHGIGHLRFIEQEYSKVRFHTSITELHNKDTS